MSIPRIWLKHRPSLPIAKRAVLDCAILENRTLFSATPLDPALVLDPAAELDAPSPLEAPDDPSAIDSDDFAAPLELVFIDAAVDDPHLLIDGLLNASTDRELRVFQLDGSENGIQQISDVLVGFTDLHAIHLVSHGTEGQIRLGNQWLHQGNLEDYADEFASWNAALVEDADLLLYGCDVAASEVGQEFVDALGVMCGCDVAASIDDTGNMAAGGDWQLEYSTGRIDPGSLFTTNIQHGWQHLLALQTVRDEFATASYNNNDGSSSWDGNWIEADLNGGGATGGNIQIIGQQLRVDANNAGDNIYREVDLSAAVTASLSFDFDNQLGSGGVVHLQVSSNGGGSWSNLRTYNNGNVGAGSDVVDLTSFRGPDTQIRILVNSANVGELVRFDNIEVLFDANLAAVGQDDTYVINEDTTLDTGTIAGVLGNDIDPDGDPLMAVQVGPDPANAQSFTFNPDGSFSYTPVANFSGVDTFTYQANDGTSNSNLVTVTIVVNPVNDAPTLTATGTNANFAEGAGPVTLFSASAIDLVEAGDQLREIELTVAGLQDGVDEILLVDGQAITLIDGNSVTTIANGFDVSVSVTGSTATVTITAATDYPPAQAQALVDGLQYENTSDDPQGASRTVTISLIEDSGGTANGGDDDETPNISSVVSITPVNDPPALTATGSNPTFIEGGPAVGLFSGTTVDAVEAGDLVRTIRLTVNGLQNGASENLVIDGTNVALVDGNLVTTTGMGYRVNVSVLGPTATVTITRVGDFAALAAETLIDGLQYENLSLTPVGANRTVTITLIEDAGGTASGGDDDTILSLSSLVTLVAVNDAPSLTAIADNPTFVAGGVGLFSGTAVDLRNAGDLVGVIELTVTGIQDVGESLLIDGTNVLLTNGNSVTTALNGYDVHVTVASGTATVAITRVGDYLPVDAEALIDGLQYDNSSGSPSGPGRTITLSLIRDTGGTANGGDDDTVLAVASSVTFGMPGANNRPVGTSDSYAIVGDSTLYVGLGGVLANDSDLDSNPLSALLATSPTNGTLTLNPDGSFSYTPAVGFVGTDTFAYVAHDGLDSSNPVTVSITVAAPYIPPSIDPSSGDEPPTDKEDDSDSSEATPETIDVMLTREDARTQTPKKQLPQRQKGDGVSVITVLASEETDDEKVEPILTAFHSVSLPQLQESIRSATDMFAPRRVGVNYVMHGGLMWDELDEMGEQMGAGAERLDITIGSTASLTATVSVGYVVWLIRGGHIMAGVLAQLPAWHMVDPLPILSNLKGDEEDELDDSLASLVESEKEAAHDSAHVTESVARPQDLWNLSQ